MFHMCKKPDTDILGSQMNSSALAEHLKLKVSEFLLLFVQRLERRVLFSSLQAVRLSGDRERLCFSGFSSAFKPLTFEGAGPELQ